MSKSIKKEKGRWRYWLYMLIGALIAMFLAGLVITLIFTLPVSWPLVPVVGVAVTSVLAFAVSVGLIQTIAIAMSVVLGAGLIGGLIGRGIQALVENKVFSKAKQFVMELFPFLKATVAKTATPTIIHAHINRRLSEKNESSKSSIDIVKKEQSESSLLQTLFKELNEIDLKKEGWVSQLTELRNKRIQGQEEKILKELTKHGPALCKALVDDLRKENLSKKEIDVILEKSFIKKLKILFHTDKSDNPLALQISNELEGWMNQVRDLFKTRAENDELKEALRKMDEDSKDLQEIFERYSARVDKCVADVHECTADLAELNANSKNNLEDWARLRGKTSELARTQEEVHVTMTARIDEDRKAMEEREKEDRKAMEEREKEARKAMYAEADEKRKADLERFRLDMQREVEATLQAFRDKSQKRQEIDLQAEPMISEKSSTVSVIPVGVFSVIASSVPVDEMHAAAESVNKTNII